MEKKINLSIKFNNKSIMVFLNGKMFFNQELLKSNNSALTDKAYTLLYVYKILYRFGLSGPISKKFGY